MWGMWEADLSELGSGNVRSKCCSKLLANGWAAQFFLWGLEGIPGGVGNVGLNF